MLAIYAGVRVKFRRTLNVIGWVLGTEFATGWSRRREPIPRKLSSTGRLR
jgi:hypothetical protein